MRTKQTLQTSANRSEHLICNNSSRRENSGTIKSIWLWVAAEEVGIEQFGQKISWWTLLPPQLDIEGHGRGRGRPDPSSIPSSLYWDPIICSGILAFEYPPTKVKTIDNWHLEVFKNCSWLKSSLQIFIWPWVWVYFSCKFREDFWK